MGEPVLDEPAFTAGRIEQLRQEADTVMAGLRARIEAAGEVRERALDVSGTAKSYDSRVTATVDATGVLTSLTLSPSLFDTMTAQKLAATIVATVQKAATQARADMADAMAPLREGAAPAGHALASVPELSELRTSLPEVPHTALDQSRPQDPWAGTKSEPEETVAASNDEDAPDPDERPW